MDRRIKKTTQAIEQAFLHLLKTKDVNSISVKELCLYADVNRGTFYTHYKDIYDLKEQLESHLFQEFFIILNAYEADTLLHDPYPIIYDLFCFIQNHLELCSLLFGDDADSPFLRKLKDVLKEKCLKEWFPFIREVPKEYYDYFYSFVLSGSIGVVFTWIKQGAKTPCEEMAELIKTMLMQGITFSNAS